MLIQHAIILLPLSSQRYSSFSDFLNRYFAFKVQKISVHAGFTCPNRDGSKGTGGCTYCNNQTFSPDYCHQSDSVATQLHNGILFFAQKYPSMRYLAYFQAYTNTYGSIQSLRSKYEEALAVDGVVGLVIGTRPDCVSDELLDYLEELSNRCFVLIEYGIESTLDRTLLRINRGHNYESVEQAIFRTKRRNLFVGGHLILGLPGETREEIIGHASRLSQLPIDTLKLHQLQLIKGTQMAAEFDRVPKHFHLFEVDEYVDLTVDFVRNLSPLISLERFTSQSPKELLIAPNWGLKNYQFIHKFETRLVQLQAKQGDRFQQIK